MFPPGRGCCIFSESTPPGGNSKHQGGISIFFSTLPRGGNLPAGEGMKISSHSYPATQQEMRKIYEQHFRRLQVMRGSVHPVFSVLVFCWPTSLGAYCYTVVKCSGFRWRFRRCFLFCRAVRVGRIHEICISVSMALVCFRYQFIFVNSFLRARREDLVVNK